MSFSLQEATLREPMLAHLRKLGAESSRNLALALQKLPKSLHHAVKAGPIEVNAPGQPGDAHPTKVWCLIAANNAAATNRAKHCCLYNFITEVARGLCLLETASVLLGKRLCE